MHFVFRAVKMSQGVVWVQNDVVKLKVKADTSGMAIAQVVQE